MIAKNKDDVKIETMTEPKHDDEIRVGNSMTFQESVMDHSHVALGHEDDMNQSIQRDLDIITQALKRINGTIHS